MKLTTISTSPMVIPPTRRRNPLTFPPTRPSLSISARPSKSITLLPVFSSKQSSSTAGEPKVSAFEVDEAPSEGLSESENFRVQVGSPVVPLSPTKLSLSNQVFFLFTFVACTTSVAFVSLVVAAVPTLFAMGRAATSLAKLADTAREELPSTMTAIRLSGMEISDLTLELSDLSQDIAEGMNKSAKVVKAAEAGIRQIGSLAHHRTVSMIQERANLPVISLQPVVAGAAKKTSRAVGQATKKLISMISRAELSSDNDQSTDRVEIK